MDSEFVRRISEVARINQLLFFNPEATIQRQIVQDGFAPNSGEFEMKFGPARYVAQQAEHLRTGEVRVYFVKRTSGSAWVSEPGHRVAAMQHGVNFVKRTSGIACNGFPWARPSGRDGSGSGRAEDAPTAMDSEFVRRISEVARINQLLFFNPEATIQRQIVQDGFAPNSGEFEMKFGPARYVAQQAEHLRTGKARVYFVKRTSGSACNGFPWARPSEMDRSGSGRTEGDLRGLLAPSRPDAGVSGTPQGMHRAQRVGRRAASCRRRAPVRAMAVR